MSDISRQSKKYAFRFKDKKIIIAKLPTDQEFQVYAKALAFGLYHTQYPTLRVDAKLEDRYQPDLCAEHYDGTMLLWVECGKVSLNKVEKLFKKYRRARFVFVKDKNDVSMFRTQMDKKFKKAPRLPMVDIVVYPEHFHDWYVSEEGDVFIPREEVTTIPWPDEHAS